MSSHFVEHILFIPSLTLHAQQVIDHATKLFGDKVTFQMKNTKQIGQVDMLKQIEAGIEQITWVVQNNSASAEETSAVSEELSAQATNLESMVEQFVLQEEK